MRYLQRLEPAAIGVAQQELLTVEVDIIDVVAIDNQAAANAYKGFCLLGQLLTHHSLQLSKLEEHNTLLIPHNVQCGVIAVCLYADDILGI